MSRRACLAALLLLPLFATSCARQPAPKPDISQPAPRPVIVFMTDFGTANDSVAICKAVIAGIAPAAHLTDITHQVTPFSIEEGARFLAGVSPYYPAGTVFLAVVDPGVGTSRKAVIVKTKKGQYFVLPDNGLITPVLERDGLDIAREITNQNWMIQAPLSSTFHGRDVFSPAAAHLAVGWEFNLVGPVVPQLVRLAPKVSTTDEKGIAGEVIALDDPYGSLITDIPGEEFNLLGYDLGDKVPVRLDPCGACPSSRDKSFTIPYVRTFMDVAVGEPLLFIDSRGRVSLAVNERNFSQIYKIAPPAGVFIPRKPVPLKTR
jgi:S-adenosylmethionine hydrolase